MNDATALAELPEHVQIACHKLGPPREEFAGSRANAIAGMILGILGVIVGLAGALFMVVYVFVKGFDIRVISGAVLLALAWAGWATFRWGIRNRSARMYVCEKGIVHRVSDSVTLYAFDELTEIMQDRVQDGLDENGCPFMNRGTTFLVKRRDGAELGVDANLVKQHVKFMRAVYAASRPYGVRWVLFQG